ncbi:MAG TPA: hypothetical protein VLQ93_07060 [Myxococcaceae bacterium]|nr:hypothetical protein [Myxococcaceae bacterium]
MSSRFNRFLHLENARGDKSRPEGQTKLHDGGRFESVAGPGEARPAVSVPEAHVERFKRHGEKPLALDEKAAPSQRFPICARCESANGRFSQECITCGADLTTPEQRAHTAHYWEAREQAEAQSRADQEAFARQQQENEAERRKEAERYADELLSQLKKERPAGRWQALATPSLGWGLLRLIPHPYVRWGVLTCVVGLPVLLVRFGNRSTRGFGVSLGLLVFFLLVPHSLWARRYGRRW